MSEVKTKAPAKKAAPKTPKMQDVALLAQQIVAACEAMGTANKVVSDMHERAGAIDRLGRAVQKYKRFDAQALGLTQPVLVTHPTTGTSQEIRLPRFAVVQLHSKKKPGYAVGSVAEAHAELGLGRYTRLHGFSLGAEYVSCELTGATEAFQRGGAWDGQDEIRLQAKAPAVPASIREQVAGVAEDFDSLALVYEAEWEVHQVAPDPLVIGTTAGHNFLVAQFDLTKMESYIASEFTE